MMEGTTSFDERAARRWTNGKTAWRTIDLGAVEFIPLGEGRAYCVEDLSIAIFRQRNGQLFATENACPHRGGPLADGIVGGDAVICPLHAKKFDLTTGRCLGENAAIRTYPVREVEGHIFLELP
jgi:nitrite reductase (NADH) small subunit